MRIAVDRAVYRSQPDRGGENERGVPPAETGAQCRIHLAGILPEPHVLTFGTLDPAATRANQQVAHALAKMRYGLLIRYPVVPDHAVTPDLERTHSVWLVGDSSTNRIVRRLDQRLPIRVQSESVTLGTQSFRGEDVGAIFIYPNPDHPHRYVVAVEAVDVRGLWLALALPRLLPDFLVFDAGLAASAGEQVLSTGQVLAGGFFNHDWSVPQQTRDLHAR